jgi:hypothetical protein
MPVEELKVFPVGGQNIVHVPNGRGEELRVHLESHGIHSQVSPAAETGYDRLVVEGGVDPESLQAILDQWER